MLLRAVCNRLLVASRTAVTKTTPILSRSAAFSATSSPTNAASKLLSTQLLDPAAELDEFMSVFPEVVQNVTAAVQRYEMPHTTQASTWLAQAMLYNVPKGKRNRGLLTVSTFKLLQSQQQLPADEATGKRSFRKSSIWVHS